MSSLRTFVAIEVPDDIKKKISEIQTILKAFNERISWVKPENIHLTLKFLGDTDSNRVETIAERLKLAAGKSQPFSIEVRGLGAFPNLRRPRTLWAGVHGSEAKIGELASNIDQELAALGFPKETRKFNPHLTIGRVKSSTGTGFNKSMQTQPFSAGQMVVERIAFINSELTPNGAVYTPLYFLALAQP